MSRRSDRPDRAQDDRRPWHDRESRDLRSYRTGKRRRRSSERSHRPTSSRQFRRARRSLLSVSGIVLLTATKAADAATTAVGLVYIPGIYEANTVVALLLHEVGVTTGLLVSSFVVVGVITLVTEIASISLCARRADANLASVVRLVGYGIPSALFAAVSVYNVTKLLAGIEAAQLF